MPGGPGSGGAPGGPGSVPGAMGGGGVAGSPNPNMNVPAMVGSPHGQMHGSPMNNGKYYENVFSQLKIDQIAVSKKKQALLSSWQKVIQRNSSAPSCNNAPPQGGDIFISQHQEGNIMQTSWGPQGQTFTPTPLMMQQNVSPTATSSYDQHAGNNGLPRLADHCMKENNLPQQQYPQQQQQQYPQQQQQQQQQQQYVHAPGNNLLAQGGTLNNIWNVVSKVPKRTAPMQAAAMPNNIGGIMTNIGSINIVNNIDNVHFPGSRSSSSSRTLSLTTGQQQ